MQNPHSNATVDARVITGGGVLQALTLRMPNVSVLELDLTTMPVSSEEPLVIACDTTQLTLPAPLPKRCFVIREGGAPRLTNTWSRSATDYRPYEAGGAALLYNGEPLLIVYGTKRKGEATTRLHTLAKRLAKFPGTTRKRMEKTIGRIPVKADSEVTEEEIAECNLILLGGSEDNELVARVATRLPFTVDEKNVLHAGERLPLSMRGAAMGATYYNPLAPKRLIYLLETSKN